MGDPFRTYADEVADFLAQERSVPEPPEAE
jgi:hypothetical protein